MSDAPKIIYAAPPHDDPQWKHGAGEWDVSEDWVVENKMLYHHDDTVQELQARIAELTEALQIMAGARKTHEALGGNYKFIIDRWIDAACSALGAKP
jgi:hypothetical protein